MDNIMPEFSFLIPSYNRPKYVVQTVSTILDLVDRDIEIIVSDDASPLAGEIENNLLKLKDSRLILHFHRENIGEANNRNFLFSKARGKWCVCIGDDDWVHQDIISSMRRFINQKPHIDLFGFGFNMIDERNRIVYKRKAGRYFEIDIASEVFDPKIFSFNSFPYFYMHPATYCCKTSIMQSIPSKSNIGIGDDFYFIIDFLNLGYKIGVINKSLFSYRRIQNTTDEQLPLSLGKHANIETRMLILQKLREDSSLTLKVRKEINSDGFFERFLLWSVIRDGFSEADDYFGDRLTNIVKMTSNKTNYSSKFYSKFKQRVYQLKECHQLTGWLGMYQLLKTLFSMTLYKIDLIIKCK